MVGAEVLHKVDDNTSGVRSHSGCVENSVDFIEAFGILEGWKRVLHEPKAKGLCAK